MSFPITIMILSSSFLNESEAHCGALIEVSPRPENQQPHDRITRQALKGMKFLELLWIFVIFSMHRQTEHLAVWINDIRKTKREYIFSNDK